MKKNAGNGYLITIIILGIIVLSLIAFGIKGFGLGIGGGNGLGNGPTSQNQIKENTNKTCIIKIDGNLIEVNGSPIKKEDLIKYIDSLNVKDKTLDFDASKSKQMTYVEIKKKLEDAKYILREKNFVQ